VIHPTTAEPTWKAAPTGAPAARRTRDRLLGIAAIVAVVALHLFTLLRVPLPFVDEAHLASPALALVQTGRDLGSMSVSAATQDDGRWLHGSLLGLSAQGLAIRALGISLFSVRLASLVFGLLLLLAVYAIGHRLYGPRTGLAAVLLASLSLTFFGSPHVARYDVMVAALGFGAVALYVTDDSRGLSARSVLSGLAIGLAFELHPNAVLYLPPVAALFLLDYGWSTPRSSRFWGFVAGGCAGLAFYAYLHLLPRLDAGVAPLASRLVQVNSTLGYSRVPPIFGGPQEWLQSAVDTFTMFLRISDLRAPLVVGAVLFLAVRRSPSDRKLLALFGVLLLEFLALVSLHKPGYYDIELSPAADLVLAAVVVNHLGLPSRPSVPAMLRTALIWGLLIGAFYRTVLPSILDDSLDDYNATLTRLQAAIPPGSVITGDQYFWFGFPDYDFFNWEQLVYYERRFPGSSLGDAFRANHTDFLILGPHMREFVQDDKDQMLLGLEFLQIPRTEMDGFLARHAHLVTSITTRALGDVSLYRLDP